MAERRANRQHRQPEELPKDRRPVPFQGANPTTSAPTDECDGSSDPYASPYLWKRLEIRIGLPATTPMTTTSHVTLLFERAPIVRSMHLCREGR